MGIYNFKAEDAEAFARMVGIRTKHSGDQLEFMFCPYCKAADKWTFGISLRTGQFECKRASCGVRGNMITLSRDFNFSLGREVDTYYRSTDYSKQQYKRFKDAHRIIETKPAAVKYLQGRGISEATTLKYEITTRKDDDKVLVFPFKDDAGNLTFIKYRKTDFVKGKDHNKEWAEAGCKPILFGMNHCKPDADEGKLIITEGQIDSLSVAEAGFINAVSVPNGCNGFTWVPHCYDFVSQFKTIIVMGDCENGKITLAEEIAKRWPKKTFICQIGDYKGCKDANEILQKFGEQAVRNVILNAKAPDDKHIKALKDVKRVDIMKMQSFSSGLESLDNVLDGGFRFGQLAILTGRRGEGKSTLASMFGVNALEQDHRAFFYSGELTDFYFRNWMDCQITGKTEMTQSDYDKLDNYYGDRAFIYDQEIIQKQDEMETLPETIENAIIRRGCRYIMVDNLMTAITDDLQNDLYRHQSQFVGNLAALAKLHNVFILLICHPRKSNGELQNDDVSGSSNITDRADIVMTFGRIRDGAPDERKLSVIKNRLTGKCTDSEGIHLVYDQKSRRLAESTKDFFDMRFSWNDSDIYDFEPVEDLGEIPF